MDTKQTISRTGNVEIARQLGICVVRGFVFTTVLVLGSFALRAADAEENQAKPAPPGTAPATAKYSNASVHRKLIIQIPCFNEEQALPFVFACLPATVAGYDTVEVLVIDDGSTDRTVAVAGELGAKHVLALPHRGLAKTFMAGLQYSLALGAHTVVNFDADNQYCAADIAALTAPIVAGTAGIVIGERAVGSMGHFSPFKRHLHRAGNASLRWITGSPVTDATSGFRALRHDIVRQVDIRSTYTYTIEMLLNFSHARVPITFVPVRVTGRPLRPSRLIRSNGEYLLKNAVTIARTIARHRARTRPEWFNVRTD